MSASADPLNVATLVGAVLDALGITYSIGGSLAGSFAGEPRATLDIDMVIDLDDAKVSDLVRAPSLSSTSTNCHCGGPSRPTRRPTQSISPLQ